MTLGSGLGMLSRMFVRERLATCLGLTLALFSGGCTSGTETGNPSITGQLSYTGISSAPQRIGVGEGGSVATVKSAWFELADATISSEGECGLTTSDAFTVSALGVGDHAAGNHNATAFAAAPGRFCSLALPFVRVADGDRQAPAFLRGHAIVLVGELGDGTPFSIESDKAPLVRLQSMAGGFELSGPDANALVAFDFAAWLSVLDFSAASAEDGSIIVSEASNQELLRAFEARLPSGVALYRDLDGDGVIDSDPELLATAP